MDRYTVFASLFLAIAVKISNRRVNREVQHPSFAGLNDADAVKPITAKRAKKDSR